MATEQAVNAALEADGRALSYTRVFDAPRELVFQAWTDPQHAARWWGPFGFTTTTSEHDLRPGGTWRFVMHGPDGRDYRNRIIFDEVQAPELLSYHHAGEDETEDIHFSVTVKFETQGSGTLLSMRMRFDSAEELRRVMEEFGADEGAKQHLLRLAEHLATMPR